MLARFAASPGVMRVALLAAAVSAQWDQVEDMSDMCHGDFCVPAPAATRVSLLRPSAGPISGGTQVVAVGRGFRNFASLMRCRFGTMDVVASLTAEPGEWINPTNHSKMACQAPAPQGLVPHAVAFQLSLNQQDWFPPPSPPTSSPVNFAYYLHPQISSVSPARVSANATQLITLTRSTGAESGPWLPTGLATPEYKCRFHTIVQPIGRRQVTFTVDANATVADETELQCRSPRVSYVGPVTVEVSINGQQYSTGGPALILEDNWHSPAFSGPPPSARDGAASALVGSNWFFSGGQAGRATPLPSPHPSPRRRTAWHSNDAFHDREGRCIGTSPAPFPSPAVVGRLTVRFATTQDGGVHSGSSGFLSDLYVLHLDTMTDFYPSEHAHDLTWQKLSLLTGGEAPTARSHHTLTAWDRCDRA